MPIQGTTVVDIREQIAVKALDGRRSVSEIARLYGVSRITVRYWRERFRQEGRAGLTDRSHAPRTCPHKTDDQIERLVVDDRLAFGYGSKKIRRRIADARPELDLPSRSTIDAILSRHGMIERRSPRRTLPETPFRARYEATEPAELQTIDHKGEFRLLNGKLCYPLTIVDTVSRYILACTALCSTKFQEAWPVVEGVFREHGLPLAMQSDNGPPFGSSHGRVSGFSVQLMMYGIRPVFGRPAKPQDNGRHERMHRDLKREATRPPAASMQLQQKQFDEFIRRFNTERPHEALNMERPATVYRASERPFPRRKPTPDYPLHFEKRLVSQQGYIKWQGTRIFLGDPLADHTVGIEPRADGLCAVHFYSFVIGHLDERLNQFL
jgi:putative transposase